ncbi:Transcriptional regulator SlyA [Nocardioides dokdonensis FR1436]|uniref:Transcriptional regulator SlyA n=1 Tax=Nocardioides dokdonensis FR1436 TaxID=1300347 RepID=A0A1A9GI16_9ACTN|nr:MarR family transcriptional regulator [Nocardioides dokdonensis]ANH37292.1 Transcriptional regulator SlyA [Nocardioides dokdonensis FR1436]
MNDTTWLSSTQQRTWRRWLRLNALLPAALHRGLQSDAGLSLPDFDVLVVLTDSPDARVRVAELARGLHWERSRVSHHIARMERRGLVAREDCAEDGRGAWVMLTAQGRTAIEQAAPAHVQTVRRLVFEALTPDEVDVLDTVIEKVLARLEEAGPPA